MATATKTTAAGIGSMALSPRRLAMVLEHLLRAGIVTIIWGPPGVGKTDLGHQVCGHLKWQMVVAHPVVDDPMDYKGLPLAAADGTAEFRPYGLLRALLSATQPLVVFLDDIGQAAGAVQAALMQLILNRAINGQRISEHVRFMCASNRADDRAGVGRALTPLLNRCAHLDFVVSVEDWLTWARGAQIDPRVTAFITWKAAEGGGALNEFNPATAQTQRAFPTPRSWHKLSTALQGCEPWMVLPLAAGLVGEGRGVEFAAFADIYAKLPDVPRILIDPASVPVPANDDVGTLWACVARLCELSRGADLKAIGNIIEWSLGIQAEASALLMKHVQANNAQTIHTAAGKKWLAKNKDVLLAAS